MWRPDPLAHMHCQVKLSFAFEDVAGILSKRACSHQTLPHLDTTLSPYTVNETSASETARQHGSRTQNDVTLDFRKAEAEGGQQDLLRLRRKEPYMVECPVRHLPVLGLLGKS